MFFEVWDNVSGNIIGTWDTKEEALAVLRGALAEHGPEYVETLYLGQENTRGGGKAIADGTTLVNLVRASMRKASAHQA